MKFVYYTEDIDGIWNPAIPGYDGAALQGWSGIDGENNRIIITNHSNADVSATLDITYNRLATDVTMEVYTVSGVIGEKAENLSLKRISHNGAALNATNSTTAFLWIDGKPSAADITLLTEDFYTKAGIITVTIKPDSNSDLTPRTGA